MNNEPPKLAFSQGGPKFAGPPMAIAATLTGKAKTPVALNVWVEDPKGREQPEAGAAAAVAARLRLRPSRCTSTAGPGTVTFDKVRLPVPTQGAQVTADGDVLRSGRVHAAGAGERRVG